MLVVGEVAVEEVEVVLLVAAEVEEEAEETDRRVGWLTGEADEVEWARERSGDTVEVLVLLVSSVLPLEEGDCFIVEKLLYLPSRVKIFLKHVLQYKSPLIIATFLTMTTELHDKHRKHESCHIWPSYSIFSFSYTLLVHFLHFGAFDPNTIRGVEDTEEAEVEEDEDEKEEDEAVSGGDGVASSALITIEMS